MDRYSEAQRPLYEVKANLFKGLSHPLRVRILEVLSAEGARLVASRRSASLVLDAMEGKVFVPRL